MTPHPASYRDPAGFVFRDASGVLLRHVAEPYAPHYSRLMESGLYEDLSRHGLILELKDVPSGASPGAWKVLRTQEIMPWVYPAEWSFEQLKAAALATLDVNLAALGKGMILKDATPLNIQFAGGKPMLIDTLSFRIHEDGAPWEAFHQFCTQLLYPLLLAHYLPHFPLKQLAAMPEGFPAQLVAEMLPRRARYNVSNRLYVYLPASLERRNKARGVGKQRRVSTASVRASMEHLRRRISGLSRAGEKSDWERYYAETILSDMYLKEKESIVARWLEAEKPGSVLDLGCNTGAFSLLAAAAGATVTALDFDEACIDRFYLYLVRNNITSVTPLVADLIHPLAGGGWCGEEWMPLLERVAGAEAVFALALIHHLAIAKNVPLAKIASLLHRLASRHAVVEWVPKGDPKTQELLRHREDIFENYTVVEFEKALHPLFETKATLVVPGSERVLYFLRKR